MNLHSYKAQTKRQVSQGKIQKSKHRVGTNDGDSPKLVGAEWIVSDIIRSISRGVWQRRHLVAPRSIATDN
jgi:hypothetical protein